MSAMGFTIVGNGVALTTGVSSVNTALPTDSSGRPVRKVVISVTQSAFVKVGVAGVAATTTDMICNANEKTVLNVAGFTHIAALQQGSAGSVVVTPIEG